MPPRRAAIGVERLEPRQLLAADAGACAVEANATMSQAPVHVAPVAVPLAASVAPKPSAVERFVGTFSGFGTNVKGRFDLNFFDIKLIVTSASASGFSGSITIDTAPYGGNTRTITGEFTGRLKPKGAFRFRFEEPGSRVAFKGWLHLNTDHIRGSVRMKIGPGLNVARGDVGGTFGMDRDTQPPPVAVAE